MNVTLKSQSILLHKLILFSLFARFIILYMLYNQIIYNSKSNKESTIILLYIQLLLDDVIFVWFIVDLK